MSDVARWLESFAGALARNDSAAAAGMFEATLAGTRPSQFRITGDPGRGVVQGEHQAFQRVPGR